MGRGRSKVEEIKDLRLKKATLKKRRASLFKKAIELSKITGTHVQLICWTPWNEEYMVYSSAEGAEEVFAQVPAQARVIKNDDYAELFGEGKPANSSQAITEISSAKRPKKAAEKQVAKEESAEAVAVDEKEEEAAAEAMSNFIYTPRSSYLKGGDLFAVPAPPARAATASTTTTSSSTTAGKAGLKRSSSAVMSSSFGEMPTFTPGMAMPQLSPLPSALSPTTLDLFDPLKKASETEQPPLKKAKKISGLTIEIPEKNAVGEVPAQHLDSGKMN